MKSLLLAATLLATPFAASAAFAQEGGQQFFFRHHIAGISSTDGNPWESGKVESPEEPEEPEESEEEPYLLGALDWFPNILDNYIPGKYYNRTLQERISGNSTFSGKNGISAACHGCDSDFEFVKWGRHIIEENGEVMKTAFEFMTFSPSWDYISVNLSKPHYIKEMPLKDGDTVSIYLNGQLIRQIHSTDMNYAETVADEFRIYYDAEKSRGGKMYFDGAVALVPVSDGD